MQWHWPQHSASLSGAHLSHTVNFTNHTKNITDTYIEPGCGGLCGSAGMTDAIGDVKGESFEFVVMLERRQQSLLLLI